MYSFYYKCKNLYGKFSFIIGIFVLLQMHVKSPRWPDETSFLKRMLNFFFRKVCLKFLSIVSYMRNSLTIRPFEYGSLITYPCYIIVQKYSVTTISSKLTEGFFFRYTFFFNEIYHTICGSSITTIPSHPNYKLSKIILFEFDYVAPLVLSLGQMFKITFFGVTDPHNERVLRNLFN